MRTDLTEESPGQRLALYQIVERTVRPLRAPAAYKRKIREELLAHLIAIYTEEKEQTFDPATALARASSRFGNPHDLSRDFERAIPLPHRFGFFFERLFGWRAPESVAHWALRVALTQSILTLLLLAIPLITLIMSPGDPRRYVTLRCILAMAFILPLAQFFLTLLQYKVRDHLFGVFGSSKSLSRVALYTALCVPAVSIPCLAFVTLLQWDLHAIPQTLGYSLFTGVWFCAAIYALARHRGPTEIDDTTWATLELS